LPASQHPIDMGDDTRPSASTFEAACIDLLSVQENTLSQLATAHSRRRAFDSLDLAKSMLTHFLDFAESHFDEDPLSDVQRRLYDVYYRTKDLEDKVSAHSLTFVSRLFGMEAPTDTELTHTREQLRAEYIALYRDFFRYCVERFSGDSVSKDQFLKGVDAFVGDLSLKW
jgi:hypothetical protein